MTDKHYELVENDGVLAFNTSGLGGADQDVLLAFGQVVFKALRAYKREEAFRLESEADRLRAQSDKLLSEVRRAERMAKYVREF